jgi:hypothetical protein
MRLVTRNRLRFVLKNLPPADAIRQLALHARDDARDLWRYLSQRQVYLAGAIVRAWAAFVWNGPRLLIERRRMWRGRTRQSVDLVALAQPFPPPEMQWTYPRLTQWLIENRYRPYLMRLVEDCGGVGC